MRFSLPILSAVVVFAGLQPPAGAQTFVNLGSASGFAVLAGSAITITGAAGSTTITGDIGSNPTPAVTGIGNVTFVSGSDRSGETSFMEDAKSDLAGAFDAITGQSATTGVTAFADGAILEPGVYSIASGTADITGTLTLNGDVNSIFIFKMSSTLVTASGSHVLLTGGVRAENVFWQVGSSATLAGNSSIFSGNILAQTSITLTNGALIDGRVLAMDGAVTLDYDTIDFSPGGAIPEPAATALLIAGCAGLIVGIRRIRRFRGGATE